MTPELYEIFIKSLSARGVYEAFDWIKEWLKGCRPDPGPGPEPPCPPTPPCRPCPSEPPEGQENSYTGDAWDRSFTIVSEKEDESRSDGQGRQVL